jgi:hypothetical protein
VVYASAVNTQSQLLACLLFFQMASPPRARREFHWDWHQSQSLFSAPTLKDARITAAERLALATAIRAQIGPPSPRTPDLGLEVLNANVKVIRLSQDEKKPPQVVAQVQHLCSPTGNCSLWFFRSTPHGYALLLDAIGQGFTVEKTATNGFRDLVVNMHSSATDQWLKVYRYARGRYWRVACYDADWAPLENGVVHQLKEPRITASPCN